MPIEHRDGVGVVAHALAQDELTRLRDVDTEQVAFRSGLVRLGRLCGYELVDEYFETESVGIETPLTHTDGERVAGLEDVAVVTVLRAATPFVEGLLSAFPGARQGIISASRDEEAGMGPDGTFPVSVDYVKLPTIEPDDRVIVADPMLATGSTMAAVLEEVVAAGATPARTITLSVVAVPPGLDRVAATYPDVERVTVAVDDELDEDGFIVPGLGDAGDRAFGTT